MLLGELRAEIAAVCTGLAAAGLVVGTAGNVSARAGELIAVTPSGLDYASLTAELVGVHRLDGTPVDAPLQPSSELPLHLAVYAASGAAGAAVGAIVHTHAPAATALSALVDAVPAIHYQAASFGGPVAVAPYATYGTKELAANVVAALAGRSACLMANHGAVTTGPDLRTAVTRAQALEWMCDVYLRAAAAGRPRLLPPEEIETVVRKLSGYGQRPPGQIGGEPPSQTGGEPPGQTGGNGR
ncbi:MAG TPA: class II aldolase/adducin family protein [Streptosporangiaceae bacterium]|jgi:L-fuculose-phosphate aldolase